MKDDQGPYFHGPATRERWSHLVLGAVRALCLADSGTAPSREAEQEILDATYDEAQAMIAVRRAVEAPKFGRMTAALESLRRTNTYAGRPERGSGVGHAREVLAKKREAT